MTDQPQTEASTPADDPPTEPQPIDPRALDPAVRALAAELWNINRTLQLINATLIKLSNKIH